MVVVMRFCIFGAKVADPYIEDRISLINFE